MRNIINVFAIAALLFSCQNAYAFPHAGASYIIDPTIPILDVVACGSSSDAAYGTVRLRTAYVGNAVQMRVKQSGVYVNQDIGFVGNVINASAADTFAATADNGTYPELRFYDQCGNSNDSTFVNGSTKGAIWSPYTLGGTTLRTAEFDTLNDNSTVPSKQELLLPSSMAMNMDAFSVVFIGRKGSSYSAQPLSYWEFTNSAPWYSDWYDYNDGEHIREASATTLNYNTQETGQGVYMNVIAAATSKVISNEVTTSKSKSTLTATANSGGSMGFGQVLATYNGGQDIVAQIFYNRTLSATEITNVDNYGYGLVGNVPAIPSCVVVIGDSGNQAAFVAYNQNPINQAVHGVTTPINKATRIINAATSGQTAATELTNIANYTGTCAQAGVTRKIAVVMTGANDINNGASAAATEASIHGIWTAMHNAGFKVVCVTMNNSAIVNSSLLATVNADIEANYVANNCDALADTWQDPNIGAGSSNTNATYWYSDHIHLNVNGNKIVGQYEANAINTVN